MRSNEIYTYKHTHKHAHRCDVVHVNIFHTNHRPDAASSKWASLKWSRPSGHRPSDMDPNPRPPVPKADALPQGCCAQ